MTERPEPRDGVVPARPELGGGAATPSYALPDGAFVTTWQLLFETARDDEGPGLLVKPCEGYTIASRSMACLVSRSDAGAAPALGAARSGRGRAAARRRGAQGLGARGTVAP